MKKVVLDSSVLSAFAKTGRLKLLKKILSRNEAFIPDVVCEELSEIQLSGVLAFSPREHGKDKWILVVKVKAGKPARKLDGGELGVLNLARKLGATAVLDDKDAREQARRQRITYTGTLALLKRAREKKIITKKQLKKILSDFVKNGLNIMFRTTFDFER